MFANAKVNTESSMYAYEAKRESVDTDSFLSFLGNVYEDEKLTRTRRILNGKYQFEISPWIYCPFWDKERLERKRVIGNNHVLIIFKEFVDASIDLQTILSQQVMVLFIIQPVEGKFEIVKAWRRDCVPAFTYKSRLDSIDDLKLNSITFLYQMTNKCKKYTWP